MIETKFVVVRSQLQLWSNYLVDELIFHNTVDNKHVKYFITVILRVVNPLEESDSILKDLSP